MTSESPDNRKVDTRAIALPLFQLLPIMLIVIYILEYTYVYSFLIQFGVTPEEVGISEIKLLTRAAQLTLAAISIIAIVFAVMGILFAVRSSIKESSQIQKVFRRFNLIKEPEPPNRGSPTESIIDAPQATRFVRNASVASFAIVFALIIFSLQPASHIFAATFLVTIGIMLTATLFAVWSSRRTRYLVWACGTVIGICLLALAAISGGSRTGINAANTGRVSAFSNLLGIDILQVHPEWLDNRIIPPKYTQDQDLLRLGSDGATVFLYDCRTATTYRIPLSDVVLAYALYLNEDYSATLPRLHCR